MQPKLKTIAGQPSWIIRSSTVEVAITQKGGHLAPVTFCRESSSPVQPYHMAPWHGEKKTVIPDNERVLAILRGDFFCLPFGGGLINGKPAPLHGETSHYPWKFQSLVQESGRTELVLGMKMSLPTGAVTKSVVLLDGQNVVYNTHTLEGFSGKFPIGHHATLRMPEDARTVNVSTAPFALGMTFPCTTGDPANGGYDTLQPAQKFNSLAKVPTIFKEQPFDDCSSFPRHKGFCDLMGVFHKPKAGQPAWTTAVYTKEGFLWFSLKDAAVLPCLSFWMENHGRWSTPWLGRNNCLGLEDGATYLPTGIKGSVGANPATKAGIPTFLTLSPKKPTAVRYIQGVAKTPRGFDRVAGASFGRNEVVFTSTSGKKIAVPVCWEYLFSGQV